MTHKTTRNTDQICADMLQAIAANDNQKFVQLNAELMEAAEQRLEQKQSEKIEETFAAADQAILAKRGKNPLTSEEQKWYEAVRQAMLAKDAKQAITNLEVIMPVTIIDKVMEDLRTNHPLLSKINFQPTGALTRTIYNKSGKQVAVWGELCDEIVKELSMAFAVVETNLHKLSAFLPVCKQGLALGPSYLDALVRGTLYEALANGLEAAIVSGTGDKEPIGMTRQVGDGVAVVDGVYPEKEQVEVTSFDLVTVGQLIDTIASDDDGNDRDIKDLVLIVNNHDYFTKIVPAITIMAPDGTYRNTLPYDIAVIPVSNGLAPGEAVFGLGYRYAAFAGSDTEGNIEFSDHYRFLQDQRVYLIKAFANGFPMDNSAFVHLDVSGVKPATYKVQLVEEAAEDEDEGEG